MSEGKEFEKLLEMLYRFNVAHVVTRRADKMLSGRPMAIAEITSDIHLWFITHVEGSTVQDISENPEVVACLQAEGRYISVSGLARATRDRDRIDRLWSANQAVWFEKGKEDPSLILLEILPTYGEFWDRSGAYGIDFRLREIAALITGTTFDKDRRLGHGKVAFDR